MTRAVTVLGTGIMGAGIARSLLRAGFGAAKDAGLIREAMRTAGTNDELMAAEQGLYDTAGKSGHGHEDMAAVISAIRGH